MCKETNIIHTKGDTYVDNIELIEQIIKEYLQLFQLIHLLFVNGKKLHNF